MQTYRAACWRVGSATHQGACEIFGKKEGITAHFCRGAGAAACEEHLL